MNIKVNKSVFLLISMFILSIFAAAASVVVDSVTVTPQNPFTTDKLNCEFVITGNESSYTVDVTWEVDSSAHAEDDQTGIVALDGQATSTSNVGDIEATDTLKDEKWVCIVTASDSIGNTDEKSSVAVTIVNSPPAIAAISNQKANIDVAFTYDVIVTDEDNDNIEYTLTNSPDGMSISSSGKITWTPNETQTGINSVTVLVEDTSGTTDTETFSIDVSSNKLVISSISAKCSPSCDDSLDKDDAMDGKAGKITGVEPGSVLTLRVKVENTWPDNTKNHDINDIELECVLEDIGDEDEIEETIDFGDLDPDESSDREEMEFEISYEAEDGGKYDIECTLTGEDDDGTDYKIEFTIDVETEKLKNKVIFSKAALSPSEVSCSRNFELDLEIKNVGSRDEDDVQVTVRNDELELFKNEIIDEIEEGDYDDSDTEWGIRYFFSIDDDVKPGNYPIRLEVFYDDNDESEIKILTLVVKDCEEDTAPKPSDTEEEEEEEEVVVIQQPVVTQPQTQQPTTSPVSGQQTTESSSSLKDFTESTAFIVILAFVVFGLFLLAVWLILILIRK